jgi:hypothetical protein
MLVEGVFFSWTRAKLQPFDGLPKFWRKIGVGDERKRKLFVDISRREVLFIPNDRAREFFDRLSKGMMRSPHQVSSCT